MANGPESGEIHPESEIRHSFSLLDVLSENQFEGQSFPPKLLEQIEENFYRGAPPEWLNFHIAEQAETAFVKRDGYCALVEELHHRRKLPGILTVKLFHQPGCGGTTLAMQVLWDLRKTFRCAVLTGQTSDIANIAKEVVCLFTDGSSRGRQKTVLLLLNEERIVETLQDSIMMEFAENRIFTRMPVVIFLICVRKDAVVQADHVALEAELSETEKEKFNEKKDELIRRYRDKHKDFHGFNIMQSNFSQAYVEQACKVFSAVKKGNRSLKIQAAAFLSLLNAYVPGSYLLESQCLDLFQHEDDIEDLSLEERMEPFSHLIITFPQNMKTRKKVRMAHPMIAQRCTEMMAEADVTRSDTAKSLVAHLCKDETPPFLLGFMKDLLTKRRAKPKDMNSKDDRIRGAEFKEELERFSRLILDIQKMESKAQSASVLLLATTTFDENPFFPQALARFNYIELKDFNQAEMWAKRAKKRDPKNSFVADTLGQVHKNHLKHMESPDNPKEVLQLAKSAIKAFKHEEQLAENEQGTDMKDDGTVKIQHIFNTRGLFGYLQVCNLVYDLLVSHDTTWRKVLTQKTCMDLLGKKEINRFHDLVTSLRDEAENKCAFLEKYLMYSKPDMKTEDPSYIHRDVSECYWKYVVDSEPQQCERRADLIRKLKQNLDDASVEGLSCLCRKYTESDLSEITKPWEEIFLHATCKSLSALGQKRPPSSKDAPESHMSALLLCWPADSTDKCAFDLNKHVKCMRRSYTHTYKKYFRSRYLCPLFFIGKGQDLNRIVHRKVLEQLCLEENKETIQDWSNDKIFLHPMVQERLLKVEGEVRNYRVYATVGGEPIEVEANLRNSLWRSRQVSFYLGFTIRGPVAFGIQTKPAEKAKTSEGDPSEPGLPDPDPTDITDGPYWSLTFGARCGEMNSRDLTKVSPEVIRMDDALTFCLQSEAGKYECSVSAMRWVCKEAVCFRYKFISWEEHVSRDVCSDYMPAGPLVDVRVTAGKMEELHLPHWISTDRGSSVSDTFAVLHVDPCADVVEHVAQVSTSYIKFLQPSFLRKGIMIQKKQEVLIYCDVLIYKTRRELPTLDVYVVPRDPALKQEVEQRETSFGSLKIPKPGPDKPLKMGDAFLLTTDKTDANIRPGIQLLRYDGGRFFEVFIGNADSDLTLRLRSEKNTIWTCTIRTGDYKNALTG